MASEALGLGGRGLNRDELELFGEVNEVCLCSEVSCSRVGLCLVLEDVGLDDGYGSQIIDGLSYAVEGVG